jgi:hypothetical protein
MAHANRVSLLTVLVVLASGAPLAAAAELPSDLCSLLPARTLSKTLGSTYAAPKESVAPRPFRDANSGTDCRYESAHSSVLFRVYVDPSPAASADLFARLKSFFGRGSTDVTGIGDDAYLDGDRAIHVRKGKVRYFIGGDGTEEQVKELAVSVAGQL